jgi:hypothetical protein
MMSVYFDILFQGLIVQADAVSTPYSYEQCVLYVVNSGSAVCTEWRTIEVESAPVIPPFTYNNQCSSVLLTAYIPVLIIGFSIQLVLCFLVPSIMFQAGRFCNIAELIHRKLIYGILWPDFWAAGEKDSELACRNKASLEQDPTIIINTRSILCFNVLNNLVTMLTFGLCSPFLAAAVACAAVSQISMLLLLVGRFTVVLTSSRSSDSSCESLHFSLSALGNIWFPVTEVLRQSFWLIVWISAVFMSLMCWDIAGDEVGWAESVWIPAVAVGYSVLLWMIVFFVRKRGTCQQQRCGLLRGPSAGHGRTLPPDVRRLLQAQVVAASSSAVTAASSVPPLEL